MDRTVVSRPELRLSVPLALPPTYGVAPCRPAAIFPTATITLYHGYDKANVHAEMEGLADSVECDVIFNSHQISTHSFEFLYDKQDVVQRAMASLVFLLPKIAGRLAEVSDELDTARYDLERVREVRAFKRTNTLAAFPAAPIGRHRTYNAGTRK